MKAHFNKEFFMAFPGAPPHDFRIESSVSTDDSLLPESDIKHLYADASLAVAVAVAVKIVADPSCEEVRVVHVPSGEVVFKTPASGDDNPSAG
jgi:hypothetical protein